MAPAGMAMYMDNIGQGSIGFHLTANLTSRQSEVSEGRILQKGNKNIRFIPFNILNFQPVKIRVFAL